MRISDWSSDVCSSDLARAGAGLMKQLRSILSLGIGYLQARGHLRRSGAEVAVGCGGYPSVPTVMAASHRGLRVVLHEQNSVLGRANRLLAGRAAIVATCFARVEGVAPGDLGKLRRTGNPVRSEEHTSELQSLIRTSYAVFCLKKNK